MHYHNPRKLLLVTGYGVTALVLVSATANENAKIAGHLIPRQDVRVPGPVCRTALQPCNPGEERLSVNGTIGRSYDLCIYLLDASSDAGAIEFGIEYGQGVKVFSWQSCAESQITVTSEQGYPWPSSGSGNLLIIGNRTPKITQDEDLGTTVLLGTLYVYAYAAGVLKFTGYPRKGEAAPWALGAYVTDGNNRETQLIYPDNYGEIAGSS